MQPHVLAQAPPGDPGIAPTLIMFGLLFGSTWMVNSLVFFAILCSVLLAILVSSRMKIANPWPLYALLLGTLLLNYAVRPESLLLDAPALRYLVAGALAFAGVDRGLTFAVTLPVLVLGVAFGGLWGLAEGLTRGIF